MSSKIGTLNILHLSDLHIGAFARKNSEEWAIKICDDLFANYKKPIHLIVVTGDIFDSSKLTEKKSLEDAVSFFKRVIRKINTNNKSYNCNALTQKDVIFVPGNHDIKRDEDDIYCYYKQFLEAFYSPEYNYADYYNENFSIYRIFESKKIILIGFNSCRVDIVETEDKTAKAIQEIDLSELLDSDEIKEVKEKILNKLKQKTNVDDYGEILISQIDDAFENLNCNLDDYTIIGAFHHHFYPFPEIQDKKGDPKIIRNYVDVINKFKMNNIKIILHGHKHQAQTKPIIDENYYMNPDRIIHVFAGGSVGSKQVDNKAFRVVEVHPPKQDVLVQEFRFEYTGETLRKLQEPMTIPPRNKNERASTRDFKNILEDNWHDIFSIYCDIEKTDNISQGYRIERIREPLSKIFTSYYSSNKFLEQNPNYILLLLTLMHFRVVKLDSTRNKSVTSHEEIYKSIKNVVIENLLLDKNYLNKLFNICGIDSFSELLQGFEENKNTLQASSEYKKISAYFIVSLFFIELFLALSHFGELCYKNEALEFETNIKLQTGIFNTRLIPGSLVYNSDSDRRTLLIGFECKDPTVHKVASLIIKRFENMISEIEEYLNETGVKIYYIRTSKDIKKHYDMEDCNFEAYIPALLPLLTGENLYSQREAFIRELIQNSIDAIELRKEKDTSIHNYNDVQLKELETIEIEIGEHENASGIKRKYLKIKDRGTGMDSFKVERYLTNIGRSYYKSDEYKDLKAKYNAISNFGIGFLSVFMVASEVDIITRSYAEPSKALAINIPNYEGCFFVQSKEANDIDIGTEITIYEDIDKKDKLKKEFFVVDEIIKYIKESIQDIPCNLNILNRFTTNKNASITPKNDLKKTSFKENLTLFVPFDSETTNKINWETYINSQSFIKNHQHGVMVVFDSREKLSEMNCGIKVKSKSKLLIPFLSTININYSPQLIDLDVSRDKILEHKIHADKIIDMLGSQTIELLRYTKIHNKNTWLWKLNNILDFFILNKPTSIENIQNELLALQISMNSNGTGFKIRFVPSKKIKADENNNIYITQTFKGLYNEIFNKVETIFVLYNNIGIKKDRSDKFINILFSLLKLITTMDIRDLTAIMNETDIRGIRDITAISTRMVRTHRRDRMDLMDIMDRMDLRDRMDLMDLRDIRDIMDRMDLMDLRDIMDRMDLMDIMDRRDLMDIMDRRDIIDGRSLENRVSKNSIELIIKLLFIFNKPTYASIKEFDFNTLEELDYKDKPSLIKYALLRLFTLNRKEDKLTLLDVLCNLKNIYSFLTFNLTIKEAETFELDFEFSEFKYI